MEWFFRMAKDPLESSKRYLYIGPVLIFIYLKNMIIKAK
jgi:UDP-N-acetyl-D-mannosaminuronic acid transferase (WecB/TagA/CpsF family)